MPEGKVLVWGGLTNSWEKKKSKSKGERERYIQLNAEFQRIARRDKKVFLSEQCKEIEENNRMGKAKSLFKEIRYTKGTFHAKMSTIKDRNGKDLIEAEEIKKRWQEYTEELYKKGLNELDNHDGVVIHLDPDILEYEVKWTLRSIRWWRWWNSSWTISNPKIWCCESAALNMPANLENSAVATRPEKVNFQNPEEGQCQRMFKLQHNFTHIKY